MGGEEIYDLENVVIIGTGLMGTGIAQVAVEKGFNVTIVGRNAAKLDQSKAKIKNGVARSAKKRFADDAEAQNDFVDACLDNLKLVTDYEDAELEDADLVVEAVVENLKVKQKLLAEIEGKISETCVVATNTSSFLLEDVADKFSKKSQFAGLHFFNPVPAMKLVEVVKGAETTDVVYESLLAFCKRLGKTPVRSRDTPGFIVNRLLIPYLLEAMRMAERGDATKEDIDTAMKLGTGHPMGPFELLDYIGLDTMKFVVDGWHQRYPDDPRFMPSETLDELVKQGKLGRKTGQGFHSY
uniref:3-hydroxybutyryl-CoA dehydrogenase n=1 Tax=Panagrolaimus sp. JU765 TaxID=591449 RepID=A0AC34QQT1_9BILA